MSTPNEFSKFNDEEIEKQLKNLSKRSLEDLILFQRAVLEKYTAATVQYEQKRTEINTAKRKYYYAILVMVFVEIWRIARGKTTKHAKLREEKSQLRRNLSEEHEQYIEKMQLIEHCLQGIEDNSVRISKKENELETLNITIENIEKKLKKLEGKDSNFYYQVKKELHQHIEERDALNARLTALYKEVEEIINALAEKYGNPLQKSHVVAQKIKSQQQLNEIEKQVNKIQHPVIERLMQYLHLRTDNSLKELRQAMNTHPDYLESKQISDLIWETSKIDNRITEGMERQLELPSIEAIQLSCFKDTAEQLSHLQDQLRNLTDERKKVEMAQAAEENLLTQANDAYAKIAGINVDYVDSTYISVEKLKAINSSANRQAFHAAKETRKDLKNKMVHIKKELNALDEKIATIQNDIENCSIKPVAFSPEILQTLIHKCNAGTHRSNPIIQALSKFLNFSTPTLLGKLKEAIEDHPVHRSEANPLLEEANHYFPYIIKDHIRPAAVRQFFKPPKNEDDTDEESAPKMTR